MSRLSVKDKTKQEAKQKQKAQSKLTQLKVKRSERKDKHKHKHKQATESKQPNKTKSKSRMREISSDRLFREDFVKEKSYLAYEPNAFTKEEVVKIVAGYKALTWTPEKAFYGNESCSDNFYCGPFPYNYSGKVGFVFCCLFVA